MEQPRPTLVTQEDVHTTSIWDADTGVIASIPGHVERILVDPNTGSQQFHAINNLVRTVDGRIIDPDQERVFSCRSCNTTMLAAPATRECHACAAIVCASCASNTPRGLLCNHCAKRYARRAILRWLFSTT